MIAAKIANMNVGSNQHTQGASIGAPSETKKYAAKPMNVGTSSIDRAKKVLDKGGYEWKQAVEEGKAAVSVAAKIAELSEEQRAKIVAGPRPAHADKVYWVIYIDQPWKFETYSENGIDRSADNRD